MLRTYAHCICAGCGHLATNETLSEFEQLTGLGPTYATELLGIPYSTYAQLRNGTRTMKLQTERHIEALCRLSEDQLAKLVKEHVRDRN